MRNMNQIKIIYTCLPHWILLTHLACRFNLKGGRQPHQQHIALDSPHKTLLFARPAISVF